MLEGEGALAAPDDRLDPLADRREVWAFPGLVFAAGPQDRGVHVADPSRELASCIALIADQCEPALPACAGQELQRDLALVAFGGSDRQCSGCPVGRGQQVQAKPPEEPAVTGA